MMILAHSIKHLKNNGTEHAIIFEFESKRFEAIVVNAKEAFYVSECMLLENRKITEVDIPVYFGIGFASMVEGMLFNKVLEKHNINAGGSHDESSD